MALNQWINESMSQFIQSYGSSAFEITETVLRARPWKDLVGIAHGFGTRKLGRDEFFAELGRGMGTSLQPVLLRQIHSDIVHAVNGKPAEILKGDAVITATPGLALTIKTADCLPILILDPVARAAG